MEHYYQLDVQVDQLKSNAFVLQNHLLKVKSDIISYLDDKSKAGKAFWASLKEEYKNQEAEFIRIKALVEQELRAYLEVVKAMIQELKVYVLKVIDYKDEIFQFMNEMQQQLKPLQDMVDAIDEIDVLGVFDAFTFDFPTIPPFPTFPEINWSQLKPDLSNIQRELQGAGQNVMNAFDNLKSELVNIAKPPQLDLEFLRSDSLTINFIDPFISMGSTVKSYWGELIVAKQKINGELYERKREVRPLLKLMWVLIFVGIVVMAALYSIGFGTRIQFAIKLMGGYVPTQDELKPHLL